MLYLHPNWSFHSFWDGPNRKAKKLVQTAIILPNFIFWFIISGLLFAMFNVTSSAIPGLIRSLNPDAVITNILSDKDSIRAVVIISYVWQASGMGTIVYLAAITGIDQELYEAAMIDGAGKWKQMWHITLATLKPTIIVLFIFRVGSVMDAGFDQIYALSNPLVVSKIDIMVASRNRVPVFMPISWRSGDLLSLLSIRLSWAIVAESPVMFSPGRFPCTCVSHGFVKMDYCSFLVA